MKKLLALIFFFSCLQPLLATHNRAGEITYRHLTGRSYEVTITTYTKESVDADRCELDLFWGDGLSSTLKRSNGPIGSCPNARMGKVVGNDVKINIYKGTHTYTSDGFYTVYFEDPNRNAGINNIPQSVNVPFYVQSEFVIDAGIGPNSSPVLLNPPIDDGCLNKRFEHNPGAYDADGDSISYELVGCRLSKNVIIPTTYDPNFVQDSVKIDGGKGDLYWDVPKNIGQFNFAIEISEWRKTGNGWRKIGYVTRDMQITIDDCKNNPPVIQPVGPFCVEAGSNLNFDVTATDVDGDPVTLTAFGSPFKVLNPADTFLLKIGNPVTSTFNWNTACNHVRQQPYYVTFEAKDDPINSNEIPLVDVYTAEITVVAPAPKNPVATGGEKIIDLSWDESICKEAIGYHIYRREDSYGFVPSQCETGVPAYTGYSFLDSTLGLSATAYTDTFELKRGVRYCYMVVAQFKNEVESYASIEFCTAIKLSAPLITNVDVLNTDASAGNISVKWVFPPEVDSANFPPPYSYVLYRADNIDGSNFVEVQTFPSASDTSYIDSNLNTQGQGYNYLVEMLYGPASDVLGVSDPASSVFLTVSGSDESNILRATHNTPWRNTEYIIYKETAPGSGVFDSIGQSFVRNYIDSGLTNGDTYCYKVQTIGHYSIGGGLPSPLINHSQIACATPIDTTRPCAPLMLTSYDCAKDSIYFELSYPTDSACSNDILGYNIYFKKQIDDPWPTTPIATLVGSNTIWIVGEAITGCWAATAFDDAGSDPGGTTNESFLTEPLCIESCPDLVFPNVFTPNGDGANDHFLPLSLNDISEINFKVFNRWGTIVYETSNLEEFVQTGWDGRDQNSGLLCSDGVYFYVCKYLPQNYKDQTVHEINGFIHIFGQQE